MKEEEKRFKVKQIEKYDKLATKATKYTVVSACTFGALAIIIILAPYAVSKITLSCLAIPNLKILCENISERTIYKRKFEEIKRELACLESGQEAKDAEAVEEQNSLKKR